MHIATLYVDIIYSLKIFILYINLLFISSRFLIF